MERILGFVFIRPIFVANAHWSSKCMPKSLRIRTTCNNVLKKYSRKISVNWRLFHAFIERMHCRWERAARLKRNPRTRTIAPNTLYFSFGICSDLFCSVSSSAVLGAFLQLISSSSWYCCSSFFRCFPFHTVCVVCCVKLNMLRAHPSVYLFCRLFHLFLVLYLHIEYRCCGSDQFQTFIYVVALLVFLSQCSSIHNCIWLYRILCVFDSRYRVSFRHSASCFAFYSDTMKKLKRSHIHKLTPKPFDLVIRTMWQEFYRPLHQLWAGVSVCVWWCMCMRAREHLMIAEI